ncbi:MAG: ABC transporter ATP-binding protein [Planctomycetes bacterium]|nr:ABC transporter ATP-binding protein [Planctomycetota bacterium]
MEIRFANVSKVYAGGVRALESISLIVSTGEFVAIVGPSGCGKTTLLRLAAGLEEPTSGDVRHDERLVTDIPPEARGVAMAFQVPALYPHLTVGENLAFPLRFHTVSAEEATRRVHDIALSLDIAEKLQRMPHELSGGQRQRVALGRCLVRQPRLLLLDEPLGQLDVPLRATVREVIVRMCRERATTVLWVTHDPAEAAVVGDRVIEIQGGRLM